MTKHDEFMERVKTILHANFKDGDFQDKLEAASVLVGLAVGFLGNEYGNMTIASKQLSELMIKMANQCDSEQTTNNFKVTELLLLMAEHLDCDGNDEVGAELLSDFAKSFADHEQNITSAQNFQENNTNKLLN